MDRRRVADDDGRRTRRASSRAGDLVVVNRGVEHELHSAGGVTFVEALAPVLRDHVPDPARDLVLGEQGDSLHADG